MTPLRRLAATAFGSLVLALCLAVAALVPVLNLAVLGYLLHLQGALARGERFFAALPGLRFAPGFGRAAVLTWLWLLPVRLVSGFAEDAAWISPGTRGAALWEAARVASVALVGLHLAVALLRGGTARAFFRPLQNLAWGVRFVRGREGVAPAATALAAAADELAPLQLFWTGARAALAAVAWLAVPVGLLWLSRSSGEARPGLGLLGALLLVPALAALPFCQARFGATGRTFALLDWRAARAAWRRAPLSALGAHLALAALTTPLYLLTAVVAPRDALWPAALVFIAALVPGRALVALALRRAERRAADAPRWLRFSAAPLALALLLAWAGVLLLTPAIDHRGALGLFSPHAFVLPAPF